MEIAELILLLQNEVQRSYDLVEESIRNNSANPIYINIEKMEIELPIMMTEKEKVVDVAKLKRQKSDALKKFQLPFDLPGLTDKDKMEYIKKLKQKELKGKSIQIEVVNEKDQKGDPVPVSMIGRIRLTLKPVLNS